MFPHYTLAELQEMYPEAVKAVKEHPEIYDKAVAENWSHERFSEEMKKLEQSNRCSNNGE